MAASELGTGLVAVAGAAPTSWPDDAGRQNAERLAAGEAWEEWDLVFCSPTGAPLDPHDDWDDWRALLSAAGVREARVHDARHTAATLLLAQGTDIRVVQQILGHSQLSQTQRYTHVAAELVQHAATRMGDALWDEPAESNCN